MLKPPARHRYTVVLLLVATSCTATSRSAATDPSTTAPVITTTPTTTTTTTSIPPATTTTSTSTTVPVSFSETISTLGATELGASYHVGCPVAPTALRMLHMSYWGFDNRPHIGTMVVNAAVTEPVLTVFATLFRERFPIRRMQPVDAFGGSDPASMAADNTSGFNCRNAVASGPPRWSVHAFGEAIDVNPVENPYLQGGQVQPPAGAAFVDRAHLRPGMAAPETLLNSAFAAVGWLWGGRWGASPDYQHFSKTGG